MLKVSLLRRDAVAYAIETALFEMGGSIPTKMEWSNGTRLLELLSSILRRQRKGAPSIRAVQNLIEKGNAYYLFDVVLTPNQSERLGWTLSEGRNNNREGST